MVLSGRASPLINISLLDPDQKTRNDMNRFLEVLNEPPDDHAQISAIWGNGEQALSGDAVGLPAEETRDPVAVAVAVLVGTMTVARVPDTETVCTVPPNLLSVQ